MAIEKSCARYFVLSAVAVAAAVVMAGCFGGGGGDDESSGPITVSGVVADGPLSKAIACYDLNDNARCEAEEPKSAATDANGNFSIEVPIDSAGKHAVVVDVPADAVDKDTGAAIGAALVMSAPATGLSGSHTVFVSPLTTLVVNVARQQGLTAAAATAQVQQQLGMTASPLANFVAASDGQAAKLAATLNAVIVDITKLATAAGVAAAPTQALVDASTAENLPALAAQVASATGTAQQVAQTVSAATLGAAGITPTTVAAQAQAHLLLATPLQAQTGGPFVSARRLTYTDANNYAVRLFVGDSSQTDAAGRFVAHEVRQTVAQGIEQPFNRNRAYWTGSVWQVCDRQWSVTSNTNQTADKAATSVFCGGSKGEARVAAQDISGKTMAEVVTAMRAYPLPDSDGLPTAWGPDPALLGNAVFPAESALSSRASTNEIGNTDSYGLLDKVVVRYDDGSFRHVPSFGEGGDMLGNFVDPNVVVNGSNAVFLDQYPVPQPADAALLDAVRYLIAFDVGDSNRVRFFKCDVVRATNAEATCGAVGDGTTGAIQTQGDARVVRITGGYPAELLSATSRQRFFVERDGAVFRGTTDLQRTTYNQRLNTTAWVALRDRLGIPAHPVPTEPVTAGPFNTLRSFTFSDISNYNWRDFIGDSSVLDAQGYYLLSERRETKSGGALQPFTRNRLYWTGSEWFNCGDTGVNITRVNSKAPFDSRFCQSYDDEGVSSSAVTLDGRRISEVVRDIRRYGSKDGTFDYRNWGPDQNVHTQLANAFFPAGSTMNYRGSLRKATPIAIATAPSDQVRVAPADSSVPFNTWPFAASLDEFVAKYPGNINGGPINGATAFWVWGYNLPTPPAPEYTTEVNIRVAFDANGQKARFYRNYRSVSTGFTTAYVTLLDTTYTVETLGDKKVLKFAALPPNFEADFLFERLFAEHAGGVWYAFKDSINGKPTFSIRLNTTARSALFSALGI